MQEIRPLKHIRKEWRPRWSDAAYILVATGLSLGLSQAKIIAYPVSFTATSHVLVKKPDVDMQTEIKAARAPELALKVINDLDLAHNADFLNAATADNSLLGSARRLMAAAGLLSGVSPDVDLISKWSQVVRIQLKPDARMLDIAATAATPSLAKVIADSTALRFSKEPASWGRANVPPSSGKIESLRDELARAETERDASRPAPVSFAEEQAGLQLKERAKRIKGLVAQGLIFEAADALDTPSLRTLGDQRRLIVAELQVKGRTLLDQHPVMKDLNSRLQVVDLQIRNATARAVQQLDADLASSRAQAAKRDKMTLAPGDQSPPLVQLEQRVLDARQRLQDEMQKLAAANVDEAMSSTNYRTVVTAEVPSVAAPAIMFGRWSLAAALGVLTGSLMAAGARLFDRKKQIGMVPVEARLKLRRKLANGPALPLSPAEHSPDSWRYPALAAIFKDIQSTQGPHVVLLHGFDVETVDVELARQAANKSVLLVELSGQASPRRRTGLGDLLNGTCQFGEVIHRQDAGYDLLQSGRQSSRRLGLGLVIATLSEAFDLVVLTGLDVATNDLDLLASSLSSAILVDRPDQDEDNWQIEACLAQEPDCAIHLVASDLPSVLQRAA